MSTPDKEEKVMASKTYECDQCGRDVAPGTPLMRLEGEWEGEQYVSHYHIECGEAAQQYAVENKLWGDEYPWFQHMVPEREDIEWMLKHHPVVAERLGWELPEDEDDE